MSTANPDIIGKLRRDIADVVAEPFDPITSFYTDLPPLPASLPPYSPEPVPTGGYPIDYRWREDAEHLQGLSGEDSQC